MQVDIGNNRILNNHSSLVTNQQLTSLQQASPLASHQSQQERPSHSSSSRQQQRLNRSANIGGSDQLSRSSSSSTDSSRKQVRRSRHDHHSCRHHRRSLCEEHRRRAIASSPRRSNSSLPGHQRSSSFYNDSAPNSPGQALHPVIPASSSARPHHSQRRNSTDHVSAEPHNDNSNRKINQTRQQRYHKDSSQPHRQRHYLRPPPYPHSTGTPTYPIQSSAVVAVADGAAAAAPIAPANLHASAEQPAHSHCRQHHRRHRSGKMSSSGRPLANGCPRSRGGEDSNNIIRNGNTNNNNNNNASNNNDDAGSDGQDARKKQETPGQKPGPKLAQTKIQLGMCLKRWIIINRIGAGSFGETFTGMEVAELLPALGPDDDPLTITPQALALLAHLPPVENRKEVCIKVEQENKNVLRIEALALKKVQPCPQVVRYLGSGCTSGMNFLVMEKLGPNLAELRRRSPHGTFNIYTTLKAGISCLQAIRGVHDQGMVHRDIKPSNFVTGLPGTEDQATCFIIDFGLARRYRRTGGEIRPPRENAGFRGTSRYASVTSHHHQELGRADDLWSLLFMLVEFATGTLPWRKYKDKDDIGRCKEESATPHLVRNLPREFQPFLAHLQGLRYQDEPDYDLLLALMQRSLERRGYPANKPVDWELDPSMLEAADGEPAAIQQQQRQQQQPVSSQSANGHVAGGEQRGAAETGKLPPRGTNANDEKNRITSPSHHQQQQQQQHKQQTPPWPATGGNNKLGSSASSMNEGEAPLPQHSGLRVSDVEFSYQRSGCNEENRSNLGPSAQRLTAGDKQQQQEQHQPPLRTMQQIAQSTSQPALGHRHEDGSETPAVQASSSSRAQELDDDDDDAREFSPREGDDCVPVASVSPSPAMGPLRDESLGCSPTVTTGGAAAAYAGRPDAAKPKDGKTAPVLSPSPPMPGNYENTLDVEEENAVNDPPPPPKPQSRKSPQQGQDDGGSAVHKTPKTKSNCDCAVM